MSSLLKEEFRLTWLTLLFSLVEDEFGFSEELYEERVGNPVFTSL